MLHGAFANVLHLFSLNSLLTYTTSHAVISVYKPLIPFLALY